MTADVLVLGPSGRMGRAIINAGADALLHVTPYYNRPSQEGLFRHFEAIAKATKLPIVLYNVPSRTACDMTTETVMRLADFDNIVAIKDATGNLVRGSDLVAKVGDRMTLLHDFGEAFFAENSFMDVERFLAMHGRVDVPASIARDRKKPTNQATTATI